MAKAGKAGKSRSSVKSKRGGLDLGKFLEEVKFGNFKLDDVLEGTNRICRRLQTPTRRSSMATSTSPGGSSICSGICLMT